MTAQTIYARHRIEALIGTGGILLMAFAARSHGSNALAISLAAAAVLLAAFVLRRPRLQIDADGLVVVNLRRTYRIPWRDVAGFGFDTTAQTPCLTIRRTDGSVVRAAVVNDNYRSGYSDAQVDAITADLQERLAAANGTRVSREFDLPASGAAVPRARLVTGVWLVCCVFLLIFGIVTTWQAAAGLPKTYSRLDAHGVRASATFAGCRIVGIRTQKCRLTLERDGRTRTWTYPEDYAQFNGLAVGAPVDVLVDGDHTTTVYTAHDVAVRYNAGFGALAILGMVFAVFGFLGLAFLLWLQHLAAVARSSLRAREEATAPPAA